jgi:capsular exopolysaccharide synthesis family protein
MKYFIGVPGGNVILLTSAMSGEGKTTTTLALAHTAANFGNKVLVIEADLRKPKIWHYTNVYSSLGLTNYFISPDININDLIVPSEIHENLHFLLSGPIPPNPAEILSDSRIKELIENLRKSYDLIFIDSPPVLVSDTSFLSPYCDLMIIIAALNLSHFDRTFAVYEKFGLQQFAKKVALIATGATLADLAISRYGYGYGYGYGYYERKRTNKGLTRSLIKLLKKLRIRPN